MDKPFSTIGSLKKGYWKHEFIKVSVKENEVPTGKNSSIFATKASYISN